MSYDASEQDLIRRLALRERAATETIYKTHFGMVQTLIVNNNGSVDDARDIFQETMMVLYDKAKSGEFELNCQLKTYLYAVARRLWLKRLQQLQKYSEEVESLAAVVPVEDDVERMEAQQQSFSLMEKAMLSLGEPCRSLLDAYYIKKKSMSDIAASFGYTNAENAKNQKYKCLTRLKKLFFAQYKTQ
ncbi:RNA polymerase sigma factor [Flavihumibacter petaseus]|uniref:Putative RNA polymerase ECF-type sigma factor n=1 Tax=Flavihumibacter petaseus NBRC 106054 TaxID=1220578 RepID=A0A0E9N2P7_9BACT|nr:sigma-70 family RNA polymerase sigma factor [Flavihumibacter petaseus]GAO43605.1 putative RNA polymerase ECF-type sigma factor [Flavihumibacter petaseus NBRC 106054]